LRKLRDQKQELLEQIQSTIISSGKEVDEPASSLEVSDIYPIGREAIYTIGGLLGEIWLVLDIMNQEHPLNLNVEMLLNFFVKFFNETFKQEAITLYVENEFKEQIDDIESQMDQDLVTFNQNRSNTVSDLIQAMG